MSFKSREFNRMSSLNGLSDCGVFDQVLAKLEDDEAGEEVPARQTACEVEIMHQISSKSNYGFESGRVCLSNEPIRLRILTYSS